MPSIFPSTGMLSCFLPRASYPVMSARFGPAAVDNEDFSERFDFREDKTFIAVETVKAKRRTYLCCRFGFPLFLLARPTVSASPALAVCTSALFDCLSALAACPSRLAAANPFAINPPFVFLPVVSRAHYMLHCHRTYVIRVLDSRRHVSLAGIYSLPPKSSQHTLSVSVYVVFDV
jgi:hypothetical protein